MSESSPQLANELKEFLKRWPRFYYFVFDFFGPVYFGGVGPCEFLHQYLAGDGVFLNLGSGARRLGGNVINVDITKYEGVDIVADISRLPHVDQSADGIICDQVLEHVQKPELAVAEIYRVLRPGGHAYISTPFMYPFHAAPSDYRRYTHVGLIELFSRFEVVAMGVRCGPFSTLATHLCYLFASLFSLGNERLYWVLVYASTFIFFPVKFLDILGNRMPFAIHMSSVLYLVVKKP